MSKASDEFAKARFVQLYREKWKAQGRTQKAFTDLISEIDPSCGITEGYVSKMVRGIHAPEKYLPAICKALDVDMSEFVPKSRAEKYKYSADYADGLEGALEKIAVENFGINLTFLQAVREIVPDFDKRFPVNTPLKEDPFNEERHYLRRMPSGETCKISSKKGLLQVTKDGQTIFLTINDFKGIKEIQTKARSYIVWLINEYAARLQACEAEANRQYIEKHSMSHADDSPLDRTMTRFDLQKVDPYSIYTEDEWNKFNLPEIIYSDTKTEG
ncbi:MAG: helix-turn-helix transcriptional regulator [Clostridia bacterium]|nr:helix-turn-helix transcriptional regulator [Clostridia bacterium]